MIKGIGCSLDNCIFALLLLNMYIRKIICVLPLLALIFIACKKNAPKDGTETKNVDIYAAGYERNELMKTVAKVWKNGVATDLSNGNFNAVANAIAVSGTDIYLCCWT